MNRKGLLQGVLLVLLPVVLGSSGLHYETDTAYATSDVGMEGARNLHFVTILGFVKLVS